jgi:solute carrier family 39 (zinc transporter), member 1/2/3
MTGFETFSIAAILAVTLAGGYLPLFRPEQARSTRGFPLGQAFAAGVFLALSLTLMLPSGMHLLPKALPTAHYPLAPLLAALAFLVLLFVEHTTGRAHGRAHDHAHGDECQPTTSPGSTGSTSPTGPAIPVIMTIMIAIPSFLLGTALGASSTLPAEVILLAILAHKGSAGFALALKMVRSTMARWQVFGLYLLFACSTPLGIVVGEDIHHLLTGQSLWLFKGVVLSLAAGVFLFMAALHDLHRSPLIADCRTMKGFMCLLAGFGLTALVRLLMGEAHRIG